MTVSSLISKQSYAGDGVTTVFTVPFYFLSDSDLVVILRTVSTGVEVTQVITTNYTVSGAGNPIGGSVTMLVAPTSGQTLTIFRDVSPLQGQDYIANDALPAEVLEMGFDRLTMITQRLRETDARTLKFPESDSSSISSFIPSSVDRAGKLQAYDVNGAPTVLSIAGLGVTVNSAALIVVSAVAPPHVNGQTWINTGTANTLIFNADDGVDFIEMYRVATNTNLFTIPNLVATIAEVMAGTENTHFVTADRLAALHEEGSTIASANNIAIPGTGGGMFHITGTTQINTISGTGIMNGYEATFIFDGALILQNGANLILSGGANYTTVANDVLKFRHEGGGVWRQTGACLIGGRSMVQTGRVLQIVETVSSAVATGTTAIPIDDTIPQITEGDEYMTRSITPLSTTSILIVEVEALMAHSAVNRTVAALFNSDTGPATDAIAVSKQEQTATNFAATHRFTYQETSGSLTARTFRMRGGSSTGATTTFNGQSGARLFGTMTKSRIRITEYQPG